MLNRISLRMSSLLIFCVCAVSSESSYSQITQNLIIGNAKAMALANAVTADPPGIDSIHFNPAGLSQLEFKHRYYEVNVITVPHLKIKARANTPRELLNAGIRSADPVADKDFEGNSQSYIPGIGRIESNGPTIFPRGGISYRFLDNSRWTFGTATYATMMFGNKRPSDDPGAFSSRDIGIGRVTLISPSFAYQFNDHWAIGASLVVSSMGIGLGIDMRFPFLDLPDFSVNGERVTINDLFDALCTERNSICQKGDEDIPFYSKLFSADLEVEKHLSTTLNLGLLWQPNQWFTWGLAYQGGADDTLKGRFTMTYDPAFAEFLRNNPIIRGDAPPLNSSNSESGQVEVSIPIPLHLSTGVSVQVTPKFKMNLDYKFTQFSIWDSWLIQFKDPIQLTRILDLAGSESPSNSLPYSRGYRDGTSVAVGLEYQWRDNILLRGGVEDRPSVIPPEVADFSIPIADTTLYGIGMEYRHDNNTVFEFALSYMKSENYIPAESSTANSRYELFAQYPSLDLENSLEVVQFILAWKKEL